MNMLKAHDRYQWMVLRKWCTNWPFILSLFYHNPSSSSCYLKQSVNKCFHVLNWRSFITRGIYVFIFIIFFIFVKNCTSVNYLLYTLLIFFLFISNYISHWILCLLYNMYLYALRILFLPYWRQIDFSLFWIFMPFLYSGVI